MKSEVNCLMWGSEYRRLSNNIIEVLRPLALTQKVSNIVLWHVLNNVGKSNKLDDIMDMINADIQFVRRRLKGSENGLILIDNIWTKLEIETENRKVGADSGKTNLTAEQRIRLSQHGNVSKKFLEIVAEYQEIQTKYKVKFRDRIERQIKIVKPDATAEEIDRLIESGETELFAQQILSSPQQAEARKALSDIQDRHEDIIKIEKSILVLSYDVYSSIMHIFNRNYINCFLTWQCWWMLKAIWLTRSKTMYKVPLITPARDWMKWKRRSRRRKRAGNVLVVCLF